MSRLGPKAADYGVHMSHCNLGDYEGSCKYGEPDICPALGDEPMKPKHEIKIDVTPVVETGEKIANHAQAAAERGMGFFRDMTERMAPAPKWVSEDNPYRKAFLEAMEAIENMERQAEDDAKALGPAKPPARIHQEGRAHGLRDGRSILQRFFPPEVAGKIKPGK